MGILTQGHLQSLFLYSKRTYDYDPDVWGETLDEAIGRVKDGYAVPYPLIRKLVRHGESMQSAIVAMDAAVEARMADLDEREDRLKSRTGQR